MSNTPNDTSSNSNLDFSSDPPISFRSLRYKSIINALHGFKKLKKRKHKKTQETIQSHEASFKETSQNFVNSSLIVFLEVIFVVIYTVIIGFEMTTDEETHQDRFMAFRIIESLILAFLWFILTMRIISNFGKSESSEKHRKREIFWTILDIIVTVLISFPSSSIPFIASGLNLDYFWLKDRLSFLYVFQSLAILKLYFFIKTMRKLMMKIFVEPFFKLYLLALILLTITVYTIFAIYFFKGYIKSENPNLKYQYRFNSFSSAWTTVLQIMTFDEWGELFHDLIIVENKFKVYLFFLSWIWIGGFIFAHLFVGTYVDNFLDLRGRRKKQKKKNEKKIQEYRKLLEESMELTRNNEKNNITNKKSARDKKKKTSNFTTEYEDVRQIGLDLKSQSMQLKKLIKEFDQSRVIYKKKGTIRELDSSLSFYGVDDTLMWGLDQETTDGYLKTLYDISQNLSERSQLRDLLTLVVHEITNNSDQLQ